MMNPSSRTQTYVASSIIADAPERHGSVVAVDVSNDQIGIRTTADTDDLYLLTIQGMMGMDDGHPSRNSWG
jgi:hypothetical protein